MPRQTWIIASILSVLAVAAVVAFSILHQTRQIEGAMTELEQAQAETASVQARENTLRDSLAEALETIEALQQEIERLQEEKEEVKLARSNLETEMRAALESREITISELKGKLTVNILDRIMFDSGEAVLKQEGEDVLQRVAEILAQYPDRQIHIMGHTDNVPIRASARSRFASNWDLSSARALAAVRFLSEEAGVNPQRLAAVAHGEFHPIADNSTAEGRAQNRRIALVVLPEEFAPSDAFARQQVNED